MNDFHEPQKIDQTEFGEFGNCQTACIAMLTGIPFEDIPNFTYTANELGERNAFLAQQEFLNNYGFGIITLQYDLSVSLRGYLIVGGMTDRGFNHAVIYKNGNLWHDPHPSRDGIKKIEEIDIVYKLNPWQ